MENLMFAYKGNGLTVCDRNRQRYGDYLTVAHIDETGAYRLYVQLSADARISIDEQARSQAVSFRERWLRMSLYARVDELDRRYIPMREDVDMCLYGSPESSLRRLIQALGQRGYSQYPQGILPEA